ncbi:MAG TPA: NADH-quinone oxidoreductase subunit NuoE [Thermodesulfobacteriota bacterium]|nr:NADH-quinone oxidoreductase subunit NuoE [Thermodesulfobacteriota bacterium]
MIPDDLKNDLKLKIAEAEHPRELAVDVMTALQNVYGYVSDEALQEASGLLGMTPLELDELATFYDFIYREPVGRYIIHICDGIVCWMNGSREILDHLCRTLGVKVGETTPDGMFTILPTACLGYCDLSPAVLVNSRPYGPLTKEKVDLLIERLRKEPPPRAARIK